MTKRQQTKIWNYRLLHLTCNLKERCFNNEIEIWKCYCTFIFPIAALKNLRKLNLNSTSLSALIFEGLKVCLGCYLKKVGSTLPSTVWDPYKYMFIKRNAVAHSGSHLLFAAFCFHNFKIQYLFTAVVYCKTLIPGVTFLSWIFFFFFFGGGGGQFVMPCSIICITLVSVC